jgi:hypothetical protein
VESANYLSDTTVTTFQQTRRDNNPQIGIERNQAMIKKPVECCAETKAIMGIRSILLGDAPGYDMAGYKALLDFQAGDAARIIVATQHGFAKEGLVNAGFSHRLPFGGSLW